MLVLGVQDMKRVAVFFGDHASGAMTFVGWVVTARGNIRTRIGFDEWPESFTFIREEVLTPEQRQLTRIRKSA